MLHFWAKSQLFSTNRKFFLQIKTIFYKTQLSYKSQLLSNYFLQSCNFFLQIFFLEWRYLQLISSQCYISIPLECIGKSDFLFSGNIEIKYWQETGLQRWPAWIFLVSAYTALTHFSPMSYFNTPWKRQKTYGCLTFSGGVEMWYWTKIG